MTIKAYREFLGKRIPFTTETVEPGTTRVLDGVSFSALGIVVPLKELKVLTPDTISLIDKSKERIGITVELEMDADEINRENIVTPGTFIRRRYTWEGPALPPQARR